MLCYVMFSLWSQQRNTFFLTYNALAELVDWLCDPPATVAPDRPRAVPRVGPFAVPRPCCGPDSLSGGLFD
jgi:hypothetical protein